MQEMFNGWKSNILRAREQDSIPKLHFKVIISELFRESKQSTLLVVSFVCLFNTLIAGLKKKKRTGAINKCF